MEHSPEPRTPVPQTDRGHGAANVVMPSADVPPDVVTLARAVAELSRLPLKADLYRRVGELVREAVGDAIVAVQSYDASTNKLEVRALVGVEGLLDGILGAMGGHPVGMTFPLHDDARAGLGSGRLLRLPGGIHNLALGVIPRSICQALEGLVDFSGVFAIGLTTGPDLLGSIGIVPRGRGIQPSSVLIETLARHAAVVLHRRQVVAAWRESDAHYRLLAEHATDVVWTADLSLRFTYVSSSVRSLLGFTPSEMVSLPLRQVLPPSSLALVRSVLAEEMAKERRGRLDTSSQRVLELEALRKDGSPLWVAIRTEFVRDPDGNPVGILGTTNDITDLKRREQERRSLDACAARAKRARCLVSLAGAIGGDLREALSGTGENSGGAVARVLAFAETLVGCAGADGLPRERLDLSALVEDALPLIRRRIPVTTGLSHDATVGLPPVCAHPTALRDALAALAAALWAAVGGDGASIEVRTGMLDVDAAGLARIHLTESLAPGAHVYVDLGLSGSGIADLPDEDAVDRLIDGCGVETTQALVVLLEHGGALQATRDTAERLTLRLLLPFAEDQAGSAMHGWPAGAAGEPVWQLRGTVLVADADAGARWLAQSALESTGMKVVAADSTAAAVKALRENDEVVAIILDGGLPPAGGAAAVPELLGARPGVPVVYCSGFGEETPASMEGIAGLVQKPFLPKILIRAIREQMRR